MRKLLTLTCCFGLALIGNAQPPNQQNQNQQYNKKKGGNAPQQQAVTTAPNKVHGGQQHYNANMQGQGMGQHYKGQNKFTGQTQTNPNLNTTKFNKQQKFGGQNQANMGTNLNSSKSNKVNKFSNQTNVSGNAASTKFGKGKFGSSQQNVQGMKGTQGMKFQKQHFNLQTNNKQVVINKYKTVTFNKNYKIAGAVNWGPNYVVFANYHPIWQPQWWWTSHFNHIVFIYGGWYYWDNYYWYPAWGYAPDSVYAFDGPIYASSPAYDPAQTVANVQSALQQQGYYQGDVDGILGPQTRAALAEYQSAQGLEPTGLVDEPTLDSLGMA